MMSRRNDRRNKVVVLCRQNAIFLESLDAHSAQPFYLQGTDASSAEGAMLGRRRIYRTIHAATDTGAGRMSDLYLTRSEGAGDVPATKAFQACLRALLKETRTFP